VIDAGNFWELVKRRATETPDAQFAVDEEDRRLSFAEYRNAAERAASGLFQLGVREETPVSWMLPTWIDSMILAGALARLGAVQNPILPSYRDREVRFITRQTNARLLVVPSKWRRFDYEAMAHEIASEQRGLEILVPGRALPQGDPSGLPPPPVSTSPEEAPVRWILYTSGTTSDPKGACHTDATLLSTSLGMARAFDLKPDDRVALVFPVTHVGGIIWLMAGLASGASHILVEAFDPKTSIDVLARNGVTQAAAGTVFHQAYLAAQRARGGTPLFPSVRAFNGGGAPKPPQLHYDLKKEMGGAGIVSGYGLTECPIIAMNTTRDPDEKLAHTEGRANPPSASIRIIRHDGSEARPGEEGEIRVHGPQLCKGHVDSSLDADAFDEQGFLRTGDLGTLDADGYLRITGRLKDIIIRKGENISTKELEDLLYAHPKVADVAVIGLPDPTLGERCCAVVVCEQPDDALGFDEMVRFLKDRGLMVQKIPEQLEILAELPRNPSGKILKGKLRGRFEA
jgi:acyl-CoA synthetase (AMP-forming)/AMP-acid ligase II